MQILVISMFAIKQPYECIYIQGLGSIGIHTQHLKITLSVFMVVCRWFFKINVKAEKLYFCLQVRSWSFRILWTLHWMAPGTLWTQATWFDTSFQQTSFSPRSACTDGVHVHHHPGLCCNLLPKKKNKRLLLKGVVFVLVICHTCLCPLVNNKVKDDSSDHISFFHISVDYYLRFLHHWTFQCAFVFVMRSLCTATLL